jgi:hypothetical protein
MTSKFGEWFRWLRPGLIASLVSATALVALCAPSSALAGTYTWNMPGDFTVTGANPDHDHYGATPWTYLDGAGASTLGPLGKFEPSVQGGLAGWTDNGDTSAFVGVDPQAQAIDGGSNNEDTFAPGQAVLEPAPQHVVAVGWTSPLSATVTVTGTIVSDETKSPESSACSSSGPDSWTLELNGSPVQGQDGTVPSNSKGPQAISATMPVAPGNTIDLVITAGAAAIADPACAASGVALQIQAPAAAPAVTLEHPTPGEVINNGEPTFSGSAANAFGDSGTVTVRVYRGTSVDPSALVETLTASRSGSDYAVAPSPILYDDTYTVQAEQDDLVGDQGLSPKVTSKLADFLPLIKLSSLGSKPLLTATPTFTGVAGTEVDDSATIDVYVWSGTRAKGYPVRHLVGTRAADGRYTIQITPALKDGRYIAIASQDSAGGRVGSQFAIFQVKLHPPAVTLSQPAARTRVRGSGLVLAGAAGTALGDARSVTLLLYRGASARGRTIGRLRVSAGRGSWIIVWPATLRPGVYTVRALQRDDAGHLAGSAPHTFVVVRR